MSLLLCGLIKSGLDQIGSLLEYYDSIPQLFSGLYVIDLIKELAVDATPNLVTGGGVELTVVEFGGGQPNGILWLPVSMNNDLPQLHAAAANMRFHRRFPKRKVSSIKMGKPH
jgi:hypothetical protein